jgi:hypothetical protein
MESEMSEGRMKYGLVKRKLNGDGCVYAVFSLTLIIGESVKLRGGARE